jgi:hypothetical protein
VKSSPPPGAMKCRTAIRHVNCTLRHLLAERAFTRLELGTPRSGSVTHHIAWYHDRIYRFTFDFTAGAVAIPAISLATPSLLRELRCAMRMPSGRGALVSNALDPDQGELRVFAPRGVLTLSITVRNDAYGYCTEKLVRLTDRVIRWTWNSAANAATDLGGTARPSAASPGRVRVD